MPSRVAHLAQAHAGRPVRMRLDLELRVAQQQPTGMEHGRQTPFSLPWAWRQSPASAEGLVAAIARDRAESHGHGTD